MQPLAVLVVGVLVALAAGLGMHAVARGQVADRLEERADRVVAVLGLQLRRYTATTRAAAALRADADSLDSWQQGIEMLGLGTDLPSHLGINATTAIGPDEVAGLEAAMARAGVPGYPVKPPVEAGDGRRLLLVIDRVAPLEDNRGALGFDVLSNPAAAGAALQAYELGVPALSEALTLVQEPGEQVGLALYFPWFGSTGDVEGAISLVLRGQDFVNALAPQLGEIGVTITDESPSGTMLIGQLVPEAPLAEELAVSRELELHGQRWQVDVVATRAMLSLPERYAGLLTAAAILLVTLLATSLVDLTRRSADRAREAVVERTAELVAANADLAAAVAAKDEFLAVISHEFRTPLTVIRGFAATIADGRVGEVSSDVDMMLERIDVQSARLDGLLDDLLVAAQLQAGDVESDAEVVDVQALVAEVVRANRAEAHGATVSVSEGLYALADRSHLRRVVDALLTNAIKYGEAPIELAGWRDETDVVLRVRDHGRGIEQGQRERVFERFTQADEGSTRESRGVGLGLTIARELCELLGGTVEVIDVDGPGACFEVRCPVAVDPDDVRTDPRGTAASRTRPSG